MALDKQEMLNIARRQLAVDMNCAPQDFLNDGVVFREAVPNEGIWLDERQSPHLRAATMGKGIVVCADAEILKRVRPILINKSRDDLFSAPFLYGHNLFYIPDGGQIRELPCPDGFALHVREGADIHALYAYSGFEHAIWYDIHHPRPDALAVYAIHGGQVAGIAGSSADCEAMWQIGIDVEPSFRGMGLAACLVSRLAAMILEKGIVPFYSTASSNIASQSVACRSGLAPAWMCNYRHTLDGKSPYENTVRLILTQDTM